MKKLHEALGILLEENDKLVEGDGKAEHMMTSAEHDVLYLGGPEPEVLSGKAVARLKELGVDWDEEVDSWSMFT